MLGRTFLCQTRICQYPCVGGVYAIDLLHLCQEAAAAPSIAVSLVSFVLGAIFVK